MKLRIVEVNEMENILYEVIMFIVCELLMIIGKALLVFLCLLPILLLSKTL